ncbi:MAG TPA: glycosyltransferase [Chloroflexia bacterium]|nr:glycosyltransferase [Chloroflexia bacterium]
MTNPINPTNTNPEPRPVSVAPHEGRIPHHALKEIEIAANPQPQDTQVSQADYTLTVIIPAYNEGDAVDKVIYKIRELRPRAEIIVVDDGSKDNTSDTARRAGARVIRHPYNKGNGAAVKTGLRAAHGDVVLLLDADGQHPPEDIEKVLKPIGEYDLVVGARVKQSESAMIRDIGNGIFNNLASYLAGRDIPDLTSGFRAMKREMIMEFIHLLPNLYSYPTTSTLAFLKAGYNVEFVPIKARKGTGRSNTRILRDGVRAIVIILRIITLFAPMKIFLPASITLFVLGVLYGLANIFLAGINRIPNGSVLLILSSLFIFLFGLISEQIAAMRFESSQRPRVQGDWDWNAPGGTGQNAPATAETGTTADGATGADGASPGE